MHWFTTSECKLQPCICFSSDGYDDLSVPFQNYCDLYSRPLVLKHGRLRSKATELTSGLLLRLWSHGAMSGLLLRLCRFNHSSVNPTALNTLVIKPLAKAKAMNVVSETEERWTSNILSYSQQWQWTRFHKVRRLCWHAWHLCICKCIDTDSDTLVPMAT